MRYDTKVTFYKDGESRYNPRTSHYDIKNVMLGTEISNVTDLDTKTQVELFGAITQKTKKIRLINAPPKEWGFLMIEDDPTKYKLQDVVLVEHGYSMLVGELIE